MVFREVSVIEIREVLRAWLAGKSERAVAAQAGVDRKTGKRYVTAAVAAGCRPSLDDRPWLVTTPQILGVEAQPPEVAPGGEHVDPLRPLA